MKSFVSVLCYAEAESNRLVTVLQENTVLRSEVDMLRLKCKHLLEENRRLKQASIAIVSLILFCESMHQL